jgi:ferredoxin
MIIRVDNHVCTGHARCASLAPQVYRLDDDGFCVSDGDEVPAGLEAEARRGADSCPERAITLEES